MEEKLPNRDGHNPESEYGVFCRIRSRVGVRFLLICWSQSLVSNYKIETKNDTKVKCDFDVTIDFQDFENFGVRNKRLRPSLLPNGCYYLVTSDRFG